MPALRIINVGDSIATGMIGITSPAQHYAARAAHLVAAAAGGEAGPGALVPGTFQEAGRLALEGSGWRRATLSDGGIFGAGLIELSPGGAAVAVFRPDHLPSGFRMALDATRAVEYSVDGGETWIRRDGLAAVGLSVLTAPAGDGTLRLRAADEPVRIAFLHTDDARTARSTWLTTGIGGARIAALADALSAGDDAGFRAYAALEPDVLTLEIGTNDAIHADEEPLPRSADALRSIIDGFLRHGIARLVLIGPPPVRGDFQPGPWTAADAYTACYRPLAAKYRLPLVDLHRRWGSWERADRLGFLADHVHPGVDGHWDLGAALADTLRQGQLLMPPQPA